MRVGTRKLKMADRSKMRMVRRVRRDAYIKGGVGLQRSNA